MDQALAGRGREATETPSQSLLTGATQEAASSSIARLVQALAKPQLGPNTMEGLVRELLRPLLREWFDANLPPLVERLVEEELRKSKRPS